jgi:hypothetical protein
MQNDGWVDGHCELYRMFSWTRKLPLNSTQFRVLIYCILATLHNSVHVFYLLLLVILTVHFSSIPKNEICRNKCGSLYLRKSFIFGWGYTVAQLVEALRYKPESCGFDSRWFHWDFSLTQSFRPHYGPGVDSASNRNEYHEYFLGVEAAGA